MCGSTGPPTASGASLRGPMNWRSSAVRADRPASASTTRAIGGGATWPIRIATTRQKSSGRRRGQVLLVLRHVLRSHDEIRLLIDTDKAAALSIEHRSYGRVTSRTQASDLVEIAGVWLPRKVEHFDEQGRLTSVTTRKFEVVTGEQFADRLKTELHCRRASLDDQRPAAAAHGGPGRRGRREGDARRSPGAAGRFRRPAEVGRRRMPSSPSARSCMAGKSFAAWAETLASASQPPQ